MNGCPYLASFQSDPFRALPQCFVFEELTGSFSKIHHSLGGVKALSDYGIRKVTVWEARAAHGLLSPTKPRRFVASSTVMFEGNHVTKGGKGLSAMAV